MTHFTPGGTFYLYARMSPLRICPWEFHNCAYTQNSSSYCGADLKALCTEATLCALRRRYPQIYASSQKLQLDVNDIRLATTDFNLARKKIVPAAHRCGCCSHLLLVSVTSFFMLYLYIYPSIYMSIRLSIYLSI